MACIAFCYSPSVRSPLCHLTVLPNNNKGTASSKLRQECAVLCLCCKSNEQQQCLHIQQQQECGANSYRRHILIGMAMSFVTPIVSNASAETGIISLSPSTSTSTKQGSPSDTPEGFRIYTDDVNKFKISIPQGWQVAAGEPNGFKSVTAFYPEETISSNVSVVITGLGPDFTKIESFGKVDEFAETLVSGLDRSWQRPPGVTAKLINCKSANGFYYIEYSLQNPGEARRYLFSALGLASNGWYNRLYTITGQFEEQELENYGSQIKKAVASFKFI